MSWLAFLFALVAGASNPFQSGTNAELNKQLGQPVAAGVIVYASGLAALFVMQLLLRHPLPDAARVSSVPWWAWLGGVISVIATMAGLTLAQKLGSGIFTGASLTAAVVTSVAIDHFGLIGFRQHAISPARAAGCALMIGGLWLVARF